MHDHEAGQRRGGMGTRTPLRRLKLRRRQRHRLLLRIFLLADRVVHKRGGVHERVVRKRDGLDRVVLQSHRAPPDVRPAIVDISDGDKETRFTLPPVILEFDGRVPEMGEEDDDVVGDGGERQREGDVHDPAQHAEPHRDAREDEDGFKRTSLAGHGCKYEGTFWVSTAPADGFLSPEGHRPIDGTSCIATSHPSNYSRAPHMGFPAYVAM